MLTIRQIKTGNMVNLLSHLLTLQSNAFNKLHLENNIIEPHFTPYAEVYISLNIALALLMKVTPNGINFRCDYDMSKDRNLKVLVSSFMASLRRYKSYIKSRSFYLKSLKSYPAELVTENTCSLFAATVFYTYCLHVLAERMNIYYPELFQLDGFEPVSERRNFATLLTSIMDFNDIRRLIGCHYILCFGYVNKPSTGETVFCDDIYHLTVINTWVVQVSNYLQRETDSARNIDSLDTLVGRRRNFFERMRSHYASLQMSQ